MFRNLSRIAFAGFVSVAAVAIPASAEQRVEYRDFGQGRIAVSIPTTNDRAYALTGRRDSNWNNQNVRVIETGQGRLVLPANR